MSQLNPTREDFAALLAESLTASDVAEGTVVKGTVVAIEKDLAVIDVGLKVEGRVPLKEFGAKARDGEMKVGDSCEIRGVSGAGFAGTLAVTSGNGLDAVSRVRVAGQAWYSGRSEMIAEPGDRFGAGFTLPRRLADLDTPV